MEIIINSNLNSTLGNNYNSNSNLNLNIEVPKVIEFLTILARTVKAVQANQLNFNISVFGLIDHFQKIYSIFIKVIFYLFND